VCWRRVAAEFGPPAQASGNAMQRKPLILASLLLAAFAINLDTTIVNVALPTLVRELHASTTQLEWIVDAYNLMFAALVLAAGNLGDRVGRKGALLAGLECSGLGPSQVGWVTVRAS
jgi:MFS family permease